MSGKTKGRTPIFICCSFSSLALCGWPVWEQWFWPGSLNEAEQTVAVFKSQVYFCKRSFALAMLPLQKSSNSDDLIINLKIAVVP